jgi:hypothetical protein
MVGTKLHAALSWTWVAFEIDEVEDDGSGAWSVMVVGRAEVVTDAGKIAGLASARHVLWPRAAPWDGSGSCGRR